MCDWSFWIMFAAWALATINWWLTIKRLHWTEKQRAELFDMLWQRARRDMN